MLLLFLISALLIGVQLRSAFKVPYMVVAMFFAYDNLLSVFFSKISLHIFSKLVIRLYF